MIELLTLSIVVAIVVTLIKPGRTPPLDNPLIIERVGQFHATLAPQLNLAQPLIEAISQGVHEEALPEGDSETLCFEVRDADVSAHGHKFYLLGLTRRNGVLYFQAIAPKPLTPDTNRDTPYKILQDFAAKVLVNIPARAPKSDLSQRLIATTLAVASARSIQARHLVA